MLSAAFAILGVAVLLGAALFVRHLRGAPAGAAPWRLAALHGLLGVGGLISLILALRHPPLRADLGTAGFDIIGAVLLAIAALFGGGILAVRLAKKGGAGTLIGIHAMLAISGFVILAAYVLA